MIADDFRSELGFRTDHGAYWYTRAAALAAERGGEKQPVGLWSCGDKYRFPDGSEVLVVADRAI